MSHSLLKSLVPALIAAALCASGTHASEGYSLLYSFCAYGDWPCSDGARPGSVIADSSGNLYGTTAFGGNANNDCANAGCGLVFKISPKGREKVLYAFCQQYGCTDGVGPESSPLVRDSSGNLYGVSGGGAYGDGMIFKLKPDGVESVLYSFNTSQLGPSSGVIMDAAGNFYGTNNFGGYGECGGVLRIDPKGKYTDLHDFGQSGDGCVPMAGLFEDGNGNLYGTTSHGGNSNSVCSPYVGCGVVFEITSSGSYKILYSFCSKTSCADGATPLSALTQDTAGNLYGTTSQGGSIGHGTAFKVTGSGKETVLWSVFGSPPDTSLLEVGDSFYGTTYGHACSVAFEIDGRKAKTLHAFGSDGCTTEPVIKSNGWLYGTLFEGGNNYLGGGAVFKLGTKGDGTR
jgi:uncharacterized repeat protein (TIGR03803 family)